MTVVHLLFDYLACSNSLICVCTYGEIISQDGGREGSGSWLEVLADWMQLSPCLPDSLQTWKTRISLELSWERIWIVEEPTIPLQERSQRMEHIQISANSLDMRQHSNLLVQVQPAHGHHANHFNSVQLNSWLSLHTPGIQVLHMISTSSPSHLPPRWPSG